MYQAIEAISRGGCVEPLEMVRFDENERLLILRLSRRWESADTLPVEYMDWRRFAGMLKGSANFNGDPLDIQQEMRHEWD